MNSGQPLPVAVIGLGFMGRNHLRIFRQMEGVQVVAVADLEPALLSEATRGSAIRSYTDYRRLLADEAPRLVSVAVPTRLHREVALATIARGCQVLVEKPLASSVAEAQEIVKQAQAAGIALMVGHVERFNPALAALKARLAAGVGGRILQVQARRVGPFQPRVRDVGVVHDLATHDLDILRFLLEAEPLRVYAQTRRGVSTQYEDSLLGLLTFPKGVAAMLDVNWLSPRKVRQLTVLTEGGAFLLDYLEQSLALYRPDDVEEVPVKRREPLLAELEACVAAVRDGQPPPVSAADAIAALHLAELLVESGERGRPLEVASL